MTKMPKKKKKERRRDPAIENTDPQPPLRRRRLPAPRLAGGRSQTRKHFPGQPYALEGDNPYVLEIVRLIEHVSAVSGFSPYVILTDWIGMMEASLSMWAENMKAMAIRGQFVEDPPEIKEIFARARVRYTRASEKYPAVYRTMQEIFPQTFALLLQSAGLGLAAYGQQVELNPDVIGQVFIASLGYPAAWLDFFPPWRDCLAAAGELIPDGGELVYTALAQAALRARCAGHHVELQPGLNFETWYETILPYYTTGPVIIGPAHITSSAMLLALASRFPDWTLHHGLVRFSWGDNFVEPLLEKMVNFNAKIFGLNGYLLEHIAAVADIQAYFEQQAAQEQLLPARVSPAQVYRGIQPAEAAEPAAATDTLPAPRRLSPPPGTRSFSDLFKRSEARDGD
jgi:hypothetical protein